MPRHPCFVHMKIVTSPSGRHTSSFNIMPSTRRKRGVAFGLIQLLSIHSISRRRLSYLVALCHRTWWNRWRSLGWSSPRSGTKLTAHGYCVVCTALSTFPRNGTTLQSRCALAVKWVNLQQTFEQGLDWSMNSCCQAQRITLRFLRSRPRCEKGM